MPPTSATFFNGLGTKDRIHLTGEETLFGRAWAFVATGDDAGHAFSLPKLGRQSFENILLSPAPQQLTVAISTDDPGPGEFPASDLAVYVGTKQLNGRAVDK